MDIEPYERFSGLLSPRNRGERRKRNWARLKNSPRAQSCSQHFPDEVIGIARDLFWTRNKVTWIFRNEIEFVGRKREPGTDKWLLESSASETPVNLMPACDKLNLQMDACGLENKYGNCPVFHEDKMCHDWAVDDFHIFHLSYVSFSLEKSESMHVSYQFSPRGPLKRPVSSLQFPT